MQYAVANMDPADLIITVLDVEHTLANAAHWRLKAVWKERSLLFAGSLQPYITSCLYGIRTEVSTT